MKHELCKVKLDLLLSSECVEGKRMLEVSNGCFKHKLLQFRKGGIGMDGSLEYLGTDKRTWLRNLGKKETGR